MKLIEIIKKNFKEKQIVPQSIGDNLVVYTRDDLCLNIERFLCGSIKLTMFEDGEVIGEHVTKTETEFASVLAEPQMIWIISGRVKNNV